MESCIQLAQKLGILFITIHFLKRGIQGVTGHFCFVVGKAYRNITHDIHAYGIGNYYAFGGYDTSDGHAHSGMGIGHQAYPFM